MRRLFLLFPVFLFMSCETVDIGRPRDDLSQYPSPEERIDYTKRPVMVDACTPEYPRLAKQAGIEGEVLVRALLDTNGEVIVAEVQKSSGSKVGFDEAAVSAAYLCHYEPAYCGSNKCVAWITLHGKFRLDNGEGITRLTMIYTNYAE
jgi:TonB family protein